MAWAVRKCFRLSVFIVILAFEKAHAQLKLLAQSPGDVCEMNGGLLGRCEEVSTCKQSGGDESWFDTNHVCTSDENDRKTYVCCRKPFQIARRLCESWKHFWRDRKGQCVSRKPLEEEGEVAEVGQFPEMGNIGYRRRGKLTWICGGTLLSPYFVLTAAHCVIKKKYKYVVRFGGHEYNVSQKEPIDRAVGPVPSGLYGEYNLHFEAPRMAPTEQFVNVAKVICHPEYDCTHLKNDIALLKLERQVVLTKRVLPVCLPLDPEDNFMDMSLSLAGWGRMSSSALRETSQFLKKIDIPVIPQKKCEKNLKRESIDFKRRGTTATATSLSLAPRLPQHFLTSPPTEEDPPMISRVNTFPHTETALVARILAVGLSLFERERCLRAGETFNLEAVPSASKRPGITSAIVPLSRTWSASSPRRALPPRRAPRPPPPVQHNSPTLPHLARPPDNPFAGRSERAMMRPSFPRAAATTAATHSNSDPDSSPFPAPHPKSGPKVSFLGTPKDHPDYTKYNHDKLNEKLDYISPYSSLHSDRNGLNIEDFLPKFSNSLSFVGGLGGTNGLTGLAGEGEMSEQEVISSVVMGHSSMMAVIVARARGLQVAHKLWQTKDLRTAVEHALNTGDQSILVDFLGILNLRPSIWNLDILTLLLSPVSQLLQSKHESYVSCGCDALKLMIKNFAPMIKSNMQGPIHSVGVDISREERYNKCVECYNHMISIKAFLLKRQTVPGKLGHTYRELVILMQTFD